MSSGQLATALNIFWNFLIDTIVPGLPTTADLGSAAFFCTNTYSNCNGYYSVIGFPNRLRKFLCLVFPLFASGSSYVDV